MQHSIYFLSTNFKDYFSLSKNFILLNAFLIIIFLLSNSKDIKGQYLETFSVANKGYKINCANDLTGVNWTLSPWDVAGTCQPSDPRDPADYFNTTAGGVLESSDLDQEVYWESPLMNISTAGTVSLAVGLTWAGFDTDIMAATCAGDFIKVQYSINGGAYTMVPNQVGGNACATVAYPFGSTPPANASHTVNQGGISGNTLRIRVIVFTNVTAEIVTIDNVSVPQAGVSVGCASASIATTFKQAGSCNSANGAITVTATGATPPYNVAWSGPSSGNPAGTEIGSSAGSYTISPLATGTYTISLTDVTNCTSTASVTVTTASTLSLSTQVLNVSCPGFTNGEIDLIVNGGVPPFTYSWSNLPAAGDPQDQVNLAIGTYNVTVNDAAGCNSNTSATIGTQEPAAYNEQFNVANKGYLANYVDDFVGVNWTMSAWANQPPAPFGRDNADFFRTNAGVLRGEDFDQDICWTSPLIDLGTGTAFSVDLSWTGFDVQVDEYINVKYSINGGAFITLPNVVGGGVGTIQYAAGLDQNGSITVTKTGLSGNTIQIQICGQFNADSESMTIDNVSIPNSLGYECPPNNVNLTVSANTGTEAAANSITATATAGGAVFSNQSVTLTVAGAGITTGDYTLNNLTQNSATITIPTGLTTGTATFKIVDDAIQEALETATLTISNPSSGLTLGSTLIQNVAISDNDAPLGVILVDFNGKNKGTKNELEWKTTIETDFAYFEVQRSSDVQKFESIGKVLPKNKTETNFKNIYQFTDYQPNDGSNYYRLKNVDIDGNFNYSKLIMLNSESVDDYKIYPNPANERIIIELDNPNYSINLIDINGKYIFNKSDINNKIIIPTKGIANGLYFLKVLSVDRKLNFSSKIIVSK